MSENMYTVKEAASYLDLAVQYVRTLAHRGRLEELAAKQDPTVKITGLASVFIPNAQGVPGQMITKETLDAYKTRAGATGKGGHASADGKKWFKCRITEETAKTLSEAGNEVKSAFNYDPVKSKAYRAKRYAEEHGKPLPGGEITEDDLVDEDDEA